MAVTVVIRETGESIKGKFVVIDGEMVGLYSGVMSDKKGGFRGCGKKRTFATPAVTVSADDPAKELRQR